MNFDEKITAIAKSLHVRLTDAKLNSFFNRVDSGTRLKTYSISMSRMLRICGTANDKQKALLVILELLAVGKDESVLDEVITRLRGKKTEAPVALTARQIATRKGIETKRQNRMAAQASAGITVNA